MSPSVNKLSVLALASTVLAVPNAGHGHAHQHLHAKRENHPSPPAYAPAYEAPSAPAYGGASSEAPVSSSSAAPWTSSSAAKPYQSPAPYWPVNNSSSNAVPSSSSSVWGATGATVPTSNGATIPTSYVTSWVSQDMTVYSTLVSTITVSAAGGSPSVSASAVGGGSGSSGSGSGSHVSNGANGGAQVSAQGSAQGSAQCGQDVTVTATEKVYVTVTAGQSAPWSSSGPAQSSSQAAPVMSSAPAYSAPAAPAYSAPASSQAAPVSSSIEQKSSAPSAPSYGSSEDQKPASGYAAKPSSSAAAAPAYSSTAPSAPSYSSGSSGSSNGGKRGLAYNSAGLCDAFSGSDLISWAYNWGSSASGLTGSWNFIPTLWGTSSTFTNSWSSNAEAAIAAGAKTLFSFNEPDISSQANLSPAAAASGYKQYMQPFAGKAKLCAPAVSNSESQGQGASWLSEFLDECSDCQIDCLNMHWYADASQASFFKDQVTNMTQLANGKPVYVTEIGCTGSDDAINSFLQEVMPWMDSNSGVAGYAYYMVSDGLLMSGNGPSTIGSTYKSYTG